MFFSITGRGTVATGRVERGTVRIGDTVELVGLKKYNFYNSNRFRNVSKKL